MDDKKKILYLANNLMLYYARDIASQDNCLFLTSYSYKIPKGISSRLKRIKRIDDVKELARIFNTIMLMYIAYSKIRKIKIFDRYSIFFQLRYNERITLDKLGFQTEYALYAPLRVYHRFLKIIKKLRYENFGSD